MSRPISLPTPWAAPCAEDGLLPTSYAGPPLGVEWRGGRDRLSTRKDCPGGPLTRLLRYIFFSPSIYVAFLLRHFLGASAVSTFPFLGPIRYRRAGGELDDRVAIGSLDVARRTSSTAV
jgi:hypothetical protein